MDESSRVSLFEHQTRVAFARLAADPEAFADYLTESTTLAEVDVEFID